jgi:hypothetical protein
MTDNDTLYCDGIWFHKDTRPEIAEALAAAHHSRSRVKITYKKGFGEIGGYSPVMEEVFCYVGKSTGAKPISLDIRTRRSIGGCALLTHCIEKVEVK